MTYRILIVDDETMVRRGLLKMLETGDPSYRIVGEAADGAEALEIALREKPELIMTDISMPVMDGIELIRRIRGSRLDCDIVILSGYGEFEYAQAAIRYRVTDYLLKPMRPETVLQVVGRCREAYDSRMEASDIWKRLVAPVNNIAHQLSDDLWMASEAGVLLGMQQLRNLLSEHGASAAIRVEALQTAAALITARLESQGLTVAWTPFSGQPDEEDVEASFREWLERLTSEIRSKRNWGKRPVIQQALDYIHAHFAEPELNLDKVLAPLGISATHFYHLLKEETGKSFIVYLIHIRMENAKKLLLTTRLKTYEIAVQCGYPDYPHFAKLFKKQYGMPPNEFRRNMGVL